jgi:hypothetical protein
MKNVDIRRAAARVCQQSKRVVFLLAGFLSVGTVAAQDIIGFHNGYLTFTNGNPDYYYTVEARPNLTGSEDWGGDYRGLQDIQSTEAVVSVPVGVYYRVVGSETPQHTQVLSPTQVTVAAGYYAATNLSVVDTNLTSGNIRAGTTIFGVSGNSNVVDTSSGDALESKLAMGAKAWVKGQLVTGRLSGGTYVSPSTGTWSPLGRWCNRGDGTVVDTETGLIWDQLGTWTNGTFEKALSVCTDHWRLPTLAEVETTVSMWFCPTEYYTTALRSQGILAHTTTLWLWTSSRISGTGTNAVYMTVKMDDHDDGGVFPNLNNTMPLPAWRTGIAVWRVRDPDY